MEKIFKPSIRPYSSPHCPICGQEVFGFQDYLVSRMKRGKDSYVHTECWEKEQAERAEEVTPCPKRSKKK